MNPTLLFAAASALSLFAVTARGQAPPAPSAAVRLADGPRAVQAERLGPPRIDAGRALTPVRLRYGEGPRARSVEALVDRTAILEIDPGAPPSLVDAVLAEAGARRLKPLMPSIGLWLVEDTRGGDGLDIAARLTAAEAVSGARAPAVREAFPNLYLRMKPTAEPYTPNDPRFPGQWYFEGLRMTEAWGLAQGDPSTSIVVVDTGCDLVHPDLAAKMDPGLDVVDADNDPSYVASIPGAPHGTQCAGLIAAVTDNGEGIAGACPACRLRCVRMLADIALPLSATVEAFDFAFQMNAAVVSNSWGFADPQPVPQVIADAINNLFDNGRGGKGALVVFASGNDDREIADDEMQAVRGVLAVGAINHLEEQTSFTNYGNAVDVVAPTGTLTTDISGPAGDDPTDYTGLFGGTSSACPVAAGVGALLASAGPERTAAEIYDILIRTARPAPYAQPDASGHDPIYGYGIIDPVPALSEVLGIVPTPPPGDDEADADCSCRTAPGAPAAGGIGAALCATGIALRRARRRRGGRRPVRSSSRADDLGGTRG